LIPIVAALAFLEVVVTVELLFRYNKRKPKEIIPLAHGLTASFIVQWPERDLLGRLIPGIFDDDFDASIYDLIIAYPL
jgi:hypothetical protein